MRSVRTGGLVVRALMVLGLLTMSGLTAMALPPGAAVGIDDVTAVSGEDAIQAEVIYNESGGCYYRLPTACMNADLVVRGTFSCASGPGWGWAGTPNWYSAGAEGGYVAADYIYQDDDSWAGSYSFTVVGGRGSSGFVFVHLYQSQFGVQFVVAQTDALIVFEDD